MAMVLTHEEYLALSRDAKRYREQRDKIREAFDELVRNLGPDFEYDNPDLVERSRAALKATEDAP